MNAANTVSNISIQLLLSEPFFGQLFIEIPKAFDNHIDSIRLDISNKSEIVLLINKHFWDHSNDDEKTGLIKHEILHLILGHLTAFEQYKHQTLFHIAADLECNQYLPDHQLSSTSLQASKWNFNDTKKPLDFFYKRLTKHYAYESKDTWPQEFSVIKKHQDWIIKGKYSSGKKKIISYQIQKLLARVSQSIDQKVITKTGIPEGIFAKLAVKSTAISSFPQWYQLLNNFLAKSAQTVLKNTVHQASKRYGTIPGIKVRRKQKLLLALDTSGSMNQQVINEIFVLIHSIYRKVTDLTIVECDFEIRNMYRFKGISPKNIAGRGDTAYEPVLRFANEQFQPDALIYFTDGFGTAPKTLTDCPLLWIITSEGIERNTSAWSSLPGYKIKL